MNYKDQLIKEQDIAYKTLYNSFKMGKKSHAFLISGSKGSPLKETALFIAKSLICNEDILACESCIECKKIDNGNYADLKIINENEDTIKVEQIDELKEEFNLSAIEERGVKIYIIHLVERATDKSVNRLLKFIEEPSENIYGILTTENISKVYQTIVSRCQIIRLKPNPKSYLYEELLKEYDEETSKMLLCFNNSIDEVNNNLDSIDVHKIMDIAVETFDKIENDKNGLMYFVTKELENTLSSKKEYYIFFEVMQYLIKKQIMEKNTIEIDFYNQLLNEIMISEGKLDSNMNLNLLIDQLFINILRKGGLL